MPSTEQVADIDRIASVCDAIRADIRSDVAHFERAAFTGNNVSTMYGNLAACVDALAGMVKILAEQASR